MRIDPLPAVHLESRTRDACGNIYAHLIESRAVASAGGEPHARVLRTVALVSAFLHILEVVVVNLRDAEGFVADGHAVVHHQ